MPVHSGRTPSHSPIHHLAPLYDPFPPPSSHFSPTNLHDGSRVLLTLTRPHDASRVLADPLRNTRTTVARWWERLLVAPNCVNFHLEHHLAMTVPHYRLRRMHRLLRERGVLAEACVTRSYLAVLQRAASR